MRIGEGAQPAALSRAAPNSQQERALLYTGKCDLAQGILDPQWAENVEAHHAVGRAIIR